MRRRAILSLWGPSGGGKTTWLAAVVARLAAEGCGIATVKTCHHDAAIEPERKDSARHLSAGAVETLLLAPGKRAILRARAPVSEEEEILSFSEAAGAELVLVEGGRETSFPKVAVRATDVAWDLPLPFPLLARVGDPPVPEASDWTAPDEAARGILRWLRLRARAEGVLGGVLAGGAGRRLGGVVKARLTVEGRTLARRAEALLATHLDEIALLAPDPAPLAPLEMPFLRDTPDVSGPLGGLLAALEAVREGVLLLGVDQVAVRPATIARLLDAGLDPDGPGAAVLGEGGRIHPTVAYVSRRRRAACAGLARDGIRSLARVLDELGAVEIPGIAGEARDLDEPADLARWEAGRDDA